MSIHSASTDPDIGLAEAIDQNGRARYEAVSAGVVNDDSAIAPWIDIPPPLPPKSIDRFANSSRTFGFSSKASFVSFASLQGSSVSLLRGSKSSTEPASNPSIFEGKRRSTDDGESSKGRGNSHSSSNSAELRLPKVSLFSKLRSRSSKPNLRQEPDESDLVPSTHSSLLPPVPPLPTKEQSEMTQDGFQYVEGPAPAIFTPPPARKEKRDKGKKKAKGPLLPPKYPTREMEQFLNSVDVDLSLGIVGFDKDAMSGIVNFSQPDGTNHQNVGQGPPGRGRNNSTPTPSESQSYSQIFSNPWRAPSPAEKWPSHPNMRKVSPRSIIAPNSSSSIPSQSSHVISSGSTSPEQWVPPESWAIARPHDAYERLSHDHVSSGSDDDIVDDDLSSMMGIGKWKGDWTTRVGSRKNTASSTTSLISEPWKPANALVRLPFAEPRSLSLYHFRIYRQLGEYYLVGVKLSFTVQEICEKLKTKLAKDQHIQHNLYLKEQGRERILAPHECPAAVVKLRQEQAGYDYEDGVHLFSNEALNMLLKFMYKSQVLTDQEQVQFNNYEFVDLSGRGLRTIPVALHKHADSLISLRLSRNPMIEIPSDFIQACTALRELRLSHMSMKQVPPSLQHAPALNRLDLCCNSIKELEDAYLDQIRGLMTLLVQNNRLEKLPWHFPRLRNLISLNVSNNKFRKFPLVLTSMESLRDLDISFNMITELPEHIGQMKLLERFILAGNQVTRFPHEFTELVNLRILECQRNHISDLTVVCMLPQLVQLCADHNAVSTLDLSLGPRLLKLRVAHNDITQISFIPGPLGKLPYTLTSLDLSYAKLSSLGDQVLSHLHSLRILKLDHNSIRTIPDSLGKLQWLETLSCTDNKLDALPSTIGNLQKLEALDAHNNSLTELPQSIWYCASLTKINVTSNIISSWHDPPMISNPQTYVVDGNLAPDVSDRKTSVTSVTSLRVLPPLVHSLEQLFLGENDLTESVLHPLMIFMELRILNLSFNNIVDLPHTFFRNMTHLQAIYLSGNKLTSFPAEDLPRLTKLTTIFLNANKLQTLPHELGKVANLTILDVGSNSLWYNTSNWEFDWNWNFNTNLKYLNLSGNKRLQINTDSRVLGGENRRSLQSPQLFRLSGFSTLRRLKVLGLMDVTLVATGRSATMDIPEEGIDRRIRTSLSTVCGMGYGIADSMGDNDHSTMLDLVHEFPGRKGEAIFAMFGQTHAPQQKSDVTPNKLSKFLHDRFVRVFMTQLAAINVKLRSEGTTSPQHWRNGVLKALHWTFLKLNQDLFFTINSMQRKNSQSSTGSSPIFDSQYAKIGVSGIAIYFLNKTLFAANAGDALAVVSRQGVCVEVSRKHDPCDREETARIRSAEGFISTEGLVNDEVAVSRSFGYFKFFPTLNAKPDLFAYELTDLDEFVIIANRGLWDFVPYQTAVDIARTVAKSERPDPMVAAQKLRDFAISYGSNGSTMIMVIWVADLFDTAARSRQPTLESLVDPQMYRTRKKDEVRDRVINRLVDEVPPPIGHLTLVFTDIRNSTHLWESNAGMRSAMRLHNHLLRRQLRFCGGYEVKTEGDAFMCSFPTSLAAVWFCFTVQLQLLHEPWPLEILQSEDGKPILDEEGHLIARGLSVRMGIHCGSPLCETDVITHRMDYFGPMVNKSSRISGCAQGGQIMVSNDIIREINASVFNTEEATEYSSHQNPYAIDAIREMGVVVKTIGEVKLKGIELPEILSVIYPSGLENRHELDENPDPEPEPLLPDATVGQLGHLAKDLGMVCLSLEALSNMRIFRPLPARKNSGQSSDRCDNFKSASVFYADPNLLLPAVGDNLSDEDFLIIFESFVTRVENAVDATVNAFNAKFAVAHTCSGDDLIEALRRDNALDENTLKYISSVLNSFVP